MGDFARLLVVQFTLNFINEIISNEYSLISLCECEFEIDTRGDNCQRFVAYLVLLLYPTESDEECLKRKLHIK